MAVSVSTRVDTIEFWQKKKPKRRNEIMKQVLSTVLLYVTYCNEAICFDSISMLEFFRFFLFFLFSFTQSGADSNFKHKLKLLFILTTSSNAIAVD